MNKWDNPYKRPIIGDAKGYYAYLPAAFIYQDFSYQFVPEVEQRYYPQDGSLGKDFLVEQPNGTFVNKCFPGASVFYLPFFLLAYFLSFLFGLPLDGYAPLFQWSIAAAHLFYFSWALLLLDKLFNKMNVSLGSRIFGITVLTFGTNIFFNLVYDFSLAHVFGFFGIAAFIYLLDAWNRVPNWHQLGWMLIILSLLLITRPTNALVLLVIPLMVETGSIKNFFSKHIKINDLPVFQILLSISVLAIPLVLWKIQTDHWFVYSYGKERLNLAQPHLIQFLFSVQKGWWFWTPLMLLMTIFGAIYFWRKRVWNGVYFLLMIIFVAYIFSSWWMWTFGGGMGQRPMIDFYPILLIGFVGFLSNINKKLLFSLCIAPFIVLNIVQAYQIDKYILIGGQTTWSEYRSHFLQTKRNAPIVEIPDTWTIWTQIENRSPFKLGPKQSFSSSIVIDSLPKHAKIHVRTQVGGKHESQHLALIISDASANFYQSEYVGNVLYKKPRLMEFLWDLPEDISFPIKVYFWNHDSGEAAVVEWIEVAVYELGG